MKKNQKSKFRYKLYLHLLSYLTLWSSLSISNPAGDIRVDKSRVESPNYAREINDLTRRILAVWSEGKILKP